MREPTAPKPETPIKEKSPVKPETPIKEQEKPIDEPAKKIIERIDKDGDPDKVLSDIAEETVPINYDQKVNKPEQTYVVTRNGQMMEVKSDEMTDQERSVFEESEVPVFAKDPLENPEEFLDYLQQKHPTLTYAGENFTPPMIEKAVEWAQSRGLDPVELTPAQIRLAQDSNLEDKTTEEKAERIIQERIKRLKENSAELSSILAPSGGEYFHATPVLENVYAIYEKGLYCDSTFGLSGSAAPLESLPVNPNQQAIEQVTQTNIQRLAEPHNGHRYEIIIELPHLSPKQKIDYQIRKARGEEVNYTSYFIQKLRQPIGAQEAQITYDAILPSQYIKGYIDLDTAQFHPKKETP